MCKSVKNFNDFIVRKLVFSGKKKLYYLISSTKTSYVFPSKLILPHCYFSLYFSSESFLLSVERFIFYLPYFLLSFIKKKKNVVMKTYECVLIPLTSALFLLKVKFSLVSNISKLNKLNILMFVSFLSVRLFGYIQLFEIRKKKKKLFYYQLIYVESKFGWNYKIYVKMLHYVYSTDFFIPGYTHNFNILALWKRVFSTIFFSAILSYWYFSFNFMIYVLFIGVKLNFIEYTCTFHWIKFENWNITR